MVAVSIQGAAFHRRSPSVDTRLRPLPRTATAAGASAEAADYGRSVRTRSEQGPRQARPSSVQSGLPYVVQSGPEQRVRRRDCEKVEEPVFLDSLGVEGSSGLFRL